jgi:hypothetical protein
MPRYFDIRSTVLIVVGYGILPEEEDRPVAYVKRAIVAGRAREPRRCGGRMWMVNQEMAELFPAIAGGLGSCLRGPDLRGAPVAFTRDDRVFIQMSEDRASARLWGMDEDTTREAGGFVKDGLLDRFLDTV